ncbi:MAG: ferrous iron transport protein A [Akkermansia sp.]|nr:ferrous iron transport protein A [Akkermansia sp.]
MAEQATGRTLNQVKVGKQVRVVHVNGTGPLRQRILDMGLTRGAEVEVRRMAPLGDPLEICVRGYMLSLRKAEAACISVS